MPVVRQTGEEASGTATYLDWPRKICPAKADNSFVFPASPAAIHPILGKWGREKEREGGGQAVLTSPRLFLNFRQTDGERREHVINFRPLALVRPPAPAKLANRIGCRRLRRLLQPVPFSGLAHDGFGC